MPWLPEFGQVVEAAARASGAAGGGVVDEPAPAAAILEANPGSLGRTWTGAVSVDDPRAGHVEGDAALAEFGAWSAAWLAEREASARLLAMTVTPARIIGEFEVGLRHDGQRIVLPLAAVVEPGGERAARTLAVRIYHSQWPLVGRHQLRSPLLDGVPSLTASDVVGEYLDALDVGDADRCVATYEPDGCFREPAGPEYRVCGTAALLDFYRGFFAMGTGGGIVLEHCTITEDGVRSALEFNAVRWGGLDMPHQAGLAVYERGPSGRIANARVYDDVTPPGEQQD